MFFFTSSESSELQAPKLPKGLLQLPGASRMEERCLKRKVQAVHSGPPRDSEMLGHFLLFKDGS